MFDKLANRGDLTLEIVMDRGGGGTVSATIVVRTMFRFGLNIIEVDSENWTAQEERDLADAVLATRSIYERRDVSHDVEELIVPAGGSGAFGVINSESEAHDLFASWSGRGPSIDVFLVHGMSGVGFDGLSGGIPGPTSHTGRRSGVVVSKSGFFDASGQKRLKISYLAMLIAHEVGHYLGLNHSTEAGNLLLRNSGQDDTNLNYNPQYRTVIRFGWTRID